MLEWGLGGKRRFNTADIHVVMVGEPLPEGYKSRGEFNKEVMSGLLKDALASGGVYVKNMEEGSGLVHYYGKKGRVCEKRISYAAFVDVSTGAKGIAVGVNWCEVVVESGGCEEGTEKMPNVRVESLHCLRY